jgi:hypothetical protein
MAAALQPLLLMLPHDPKHGVLKRVSADRVDEDVDVQLVVND